MQASEAKSLNLFRKYSLFCAAWLTLAEDTCVFYYFLVMGLFLRLYVVIYVR